MKTCFLPRRRRGFTLLETVIAIGVLAVLLSGFMVVFTPAAEGIRKSINVQQADRLTSTVERELTALRRKNAGFATGFDKAYDWLEKSKTANTALLVYQYRAKLSGSPRSDGTMEPQATIGSNLPGKDYVVVPMVRQLGDNNNTELKADLDAIEGPLYMVKCTQLVFDTGSGGLIASTSNTIVDPKNPKTGGGGGDADNYPEAVIAFSADFYQLPAKTIQYLSGSAFKDKFPNLKNPVFSRNLAVRR